MASKLILVVEDNDKSRKLVRDVLTFKGYEVIEAETGEEGVRLAQARPPSLVLMDIRLPGIDGVEALRRLRAELATQEIPVMAMTASVMTEDRQTIMGAGFDAYQGKPIKLKDFVAAVEQWVAMIVLRHSITWSALRTRDWGIVNPRAFAVLRLITNLNWVGAIHDRRRSRRLVMHRSAYLAHRDVSKRQLPPMTYADVKAAFEWAQRVLADYSTAYEDATQFFDIAGLKNDPPRFLEWCRLDDYKRHFSEDMKQRFGRSYNPQE